MKYIPIPDNEIFRGCVYGVPESAEEWAELEANAAIAKAMRVPEPTKKWWQFWL